MNGAWTGRRRAPAAAALAVALMVSACGTQSGGGSGATPTPTHAAVPDDLAAARVAWERSAAATGTYQLVVRRSCFCLGAQVQSSVTDGRVTSSTATDPNADGATIAASAVVDLPRTVTELHEVVARALSRAHTVDVTYDRRGVPLRIAIDNIESAIDDEIRYDVSFSSDDERATAASDDGTWSRSAMPQDRGLGAQQPAGAIARLTGSGPTARVHLATFGSSSCPNRPLTLQVLDDPSVDPPPASAAGAPAFTVLVDLTAGAADRACTADVGPTSYAARLPADVAALVAPATGQPRAVLVLVLESTSPGGPVSSAAVQAS